MSKKIRQDILRQSLFREPLSGLADRLASEGGAKCVTRLALDDAVVVNYTNQPTEDGPNPDNLHDAGEIGKIVTWLRPYQTSLHKHVPVRIPNTKFKMSLWIPFDEPTSKDFDMVKANRYQAQDIVSLICVFRRLTAPDTLKTLLSSWFVEMCTIGAGGETLSGFDAYYCENSRLIMTIRGCPCVTYPWISLYLRLRYGLQRRDRPSEVQYYFGERC